jgi:hypothetical protein
MKFTLILSLLLLNVQAYSKMKSLSCVSTHCFWTSISCFRNRECRGAVLCNQRCLASDDAAACNLLCQLTIGYENDKYKCTFIDSNRSTFEMHG